MCEFEVQFSVLSIITFYQYPFAHALQLQLITAISYYPSPLHLTPDTPDTRNVMDTVTTQSDK